MTRENIFKRKMIKKPEFRLYFPIIKKIKKNKSFLFYMVHNKKKKGFDSSDIFVKQHKKQK